MSYTQLAIVGVLVAGAADLVVLRTRLLGRKVFWVSYAILAGFQVVTNAILAGPGPVRYAGAAILGSSTPLTGPPPFLGDWRVAYAPVEDLLFGFALVLVSQALWVWWGRRGLDRTPYAGPPRVPWFTRRHAGTRPPGSPPAGGDPR